MDGGERSMAWNAGSTIPVQGLGPRYQERMYIRATLPHLVFGVLKRAAENNENVLKRKPENGNRFSTRGRLCRAQNEVVE